MNAVCPYCGPVVRNLDQQVVGKLVLGTATYAFGKGALRNPWVVAGCVLAAVFVGHYLDQKLSERCPQCGALLKVAGLLP